MHTFIQIILLIVGFVMLVKGADWFVEGAAEAADKLKIPQIVIGLTIVAIGTSAPEAAISISAAAKHSADIAVGNVVGSNIMNVLLILGVTAVITPLAVKKSTVKFEIPFVIIISALMMFLGFFDGVVGRIDGIVLWILFILYLIYLLRMAKKEPVAEETVPRAHFGNLKIVILVIVGMALIILGSNITVDAATEIARIIGVNERIIGLTIVAFGTSLPELVTCITAGLKKKADIAIGNIVGSNIFNILFVLGTSSIITQIPYQRSFFVDSIVCIASVAILLLFVFRHKLLKRWSGIIMLALYGGYFVYILL